MALLHFTKGNTYLQKGVYTFNLPSGFTCPCAKACLTYANRNTGTITRGKDAEFTCYAARTERFPTVRAIVWRNYLTLRELKTVEAMANALHDAIPPKATRIRIHANGDFFSQDYFDAWIEVARRNPHLKFWAFTKSVPFWIARKESIPSNLKMQASYGGKYDDLIKAHGLKFAEIFETELEAQGAGLKVDTDDALAEDGNDSFALILKGKYIKSAARM